MSGFHDTCKAKNKKQEYGSAEKTQVKRVEYAYQAPPSPYPYPPNPPFWYPYPPMGPQKLELRHGNETDTD